MPGATLGGADRKSRMDDSALPPFSFSGKKLGPMSETDNSILIQVSCMRERTEDLCKSAASQVPQSSQRVLVRLWMIRDFFAALEAELNDGIVVADQTNSAVVLNNSQVEHLASALAKKLDRFVFVLGDEAPIAIPQSSKRPS